MSLIPPFFLDTVLALGIPSQDNSVKFTATGFLYSCFVEKDEHGKRKYGMFLGSVDIYIILGICQQLNYLQNNGRGCWSSFVVSQTCMSDRSPTVSGSSRPSSG